jgi:two-component system chemotaxis response regulator CheB
MRSALSALLGEDPGIEVVGQAKNGIEAIALAKELRPDVITMDVVMPGLSGLEAISKIMEEAPSRILVVCSVSEGREVDISFRAMSSGALEVIAKPAATTELRAWGRKLNTAVKLMAEIPVVTRRRLNQMKAQKHQSLGLRPPPPPPPVIPADAMKKELSKKVDIWGIVASTGGPPALAVILNALPPDLKVPILIVQHIAPGFSRGLIRYLETVTRLKVVQGADGMIAERGHIYLPPDKHDIEIDEKCRIKVPLNRGVGHCPSGNRLLLSLARVYGPKAGGVVLTGMGDDGTEGLLAIHKATGVTIAQDEASCVVYGMPQAAHNAGAVTHMLPPESIAPLLWELT